MDVGSVSLEVDGNRRCQARNLPKETKNEVSDVSALKPSDPDGFRCIRLRTLNRVDGTGAEI